MSIIILLVVLLPIQTVDTAPDKKKHLPPESRTDTLLREWDRANRNVNEFKYILQQTTEDRVLREKQIRRAEVSGKKSNLVRIDWKDENDTPTEIWLRNDNVFIQYRFQQQEKITWQLAPGFPEQYLSRDWTVSWGARVFLWGKHVLCFEIPVNEIQQHFDVQLRKEDKHWAYLRLYPKTSEYWPAFKVIDLVLDQKTHLVRQYRFLETDGNWIIYDFQEVEINLASLIYIDTLSKGLPRFKEIRIQIPASSNPESRATDFKAPQP